MTDESKAIPILQDTSAASAEMRQLLMFARTQAPAQSDIDRLSKRLSPLVSLPLADLAGPMPDLGTAPINPPAVGPSLAAAGNSTALKLSFSGLGKAIVALGIVSAGAVWWSMPGAEVHTLAPAVQKSAPVNQERKTSVEAPVEPVVREEPAPSPEPVVEQAAPRIRARVRNEAPKVVPAQVVAPSEMELIRVAEDLRAQPLKALQKLDEHTRLYPSGMLAQEREVLAIEALLSAGQRPAAEARAARLAAAYPGSAHLRRVRVLLGAGQAE